MSTLRAAYYLLLIALLMPALPDSETSRQAQPEAKVAITQTVAPASFCASHNDLCDATNYLLRKFEAKARYPLHVLSNWANQGNDGAGGYQA